MSTVRQLLVAIALFASARALALDPDKAITQYRHQVWRSEDGLPLSTLHGITQTPDGYLWLASWEGLVRFDGVRFVRFNRANTPQMADDFIESMTSDAAGTLWFGNRFGALHKMAGGRFEKVAELGGRISKVHVGPDGTVWVAVIDRGVFHLSEGKTEQLTMRDGLISDKCMDVLDDGQGNVWVATTDGLSRVTAGRFTHFTTADGLVSNRVGGLVMTRKRDLWAHHFSGGISILRDGKWQRFGAAEGFTDDTLSEAIEDRRGDLWLGATSAGLLRVRDGQPARVGARDRFASQTVLALFEDRESNLWVAVRGDGLHRFTDGRFTPIGEPEGLGAQSVISVYAAPDGAVYTGTLGAGLARVSADGSIRRWRTSDGLANDIVLTTFQPSRGPLLVGVYSGGLQMLDGDRVRSRPGPEVRNVSAFAESSDGVVWAGTRGFGLYRLRGDQLDHYSVAKGGLPGDYVTSLLSAEDGTLWIGTDGGLAMMQQGVLARAPEASGLAGAHIAALYQDARGLLWVGTNESGLVRWDGKTAMRYTAADGLCENTVLSIIEDELGYLWMGGHRGVSRVARRGLDTRPFSCTSYGVTDGLRSPESTGELQPTATQTRDGRLWFSTTRGLAVVNPWGIGTTNRVPPPVLIEELRADRSPVSLADVRVSAGVRDLEIAYTAPSLSAPEKVRFKYRLEGFDRDWVDAGTRRVAYYTNLSPGAYRFRVIACNNDGVWNEAGATLPLRLLPHFWQTRAFVIACALLLAAVIYALFRLRLSGLERQKRELARQVEARTVELKRAQAQLVQSEKMSALGQLTAGVAHELNNPVNFITSNVGALEERYRQLVALAAELEQLLSDDQARRRAAERMRAIDFDFIRDDGPDLLRAFRNGADRITAIVDRLRVFTRAGEQGHKPADLIDGLQATVRLLEPMFRDQVQVRIETGGLPSVTCNAALMNQVFMNILVNAAQAMGGRGEIEVSAVHEGDHVRLSFRDHGPGVPAELRARIFEPFFTTKEVGQGAGLGLSISFDIVRDHRGTITVGDAAGGGALFEVRLPIAGPQRQVAEAARETA
jgi:signal transduction histidine kinase/ligand-binding sensor domain-containing protein